MRKTRHRVWGWKRWAALLIIVLLLGALAAVAYLQMSRRVSWASVLEATAHQRTVNGVGRLYAPDGSQWELALWVEVRPPGSFASNSLLLPVARSQRAPSPDVVTLAQTANFTHANLGLLPRLARARVSQPGRPTTFAGQPALAVSVLPPAEWTPKADFAGRQWRFYLDPQTRLIRGLDLYQSGRLVAKIRYWYNRPLPRGFKPA